MKVKLPFNERLNMHIANKGSHLCIGLDPDLEKMPAHLKYEKNPVDLFVNEIVAATKDLVVAYKANLAFFECEGQNGLEALYNLASSKPKDVLLILDGKRGDIENTSKKYAKTYFEQLGADAVTLHPYMGSDSIKPFTENPAHGVFVLALTSNRGAEDFQYLQIGADPMHIYVAKKVEKWNVNKNCGLVAGATDIEELKILRRAIPDLPFLIPGVGAQGGMMKDVMQHGRNSSGTGMLVNVARDIIYAGSGKDFADKAAEKAQKYAAEMKDLMRTSWDYI